MAVVVVVVWLEFSFWDGSGFDGSLGVGLVVWVECCV